MLALLVLSIFLVKNYFYAVIGAHAALYYVGALLACASVSAGASARLPNILILVLALLFWSSVAYGASSLYLVDLCYLCHL